MNTNGGNVREVEARHQLPGVIAGMEKTLERELGRAPSLVPEPAPEAKRSTFATRPPLQTIADAIKRLVWDDNEKLAQMIGTHYQADNQTASMAAAIQRAADDLIQEENGSRQ